MKMLKIYASSFIFVALTAVKIAFPAANAEMTDAINRALAIEQKQTEAAVNAGEMALKRLLYDEMILLPHGMDTVSSESRGQNSFAESVKERYQEVKKVCDRETAAEAAVAAFAARQSEISSSAIPQSVIMDVPPLPFEYTSPVEGIKSSGFGYRIHPILKEEKFHYGTDFAADTGTAVMAFADGTVIAAGESDSYGNYIIIDHNGGYSTMYAHCSELCVGCGDVKKGERIALVGQSGLATGPHLHFEIRYGSDFINPEFYL